MFWNWKIAHKEIKMPLISLDSAKKLGKMGEKINSLDWSNLFKKCQPNFLSTLLQINHLLPRVSARYLVPPSPHIFSRSEQIALISATNQVLGVGQVWKISQRKFITSQEPSLSEPLFVDVKHLGELFFALPDIE